MSIQIDLRFELESDHDHGVEVEVTLNLSALPRVGDVMDLDLLDLIVDDVSEVVKRTYVSAEDVMFLRLPERVIMRERGGVDLALDDYEVVLDWINKHNITQEFLVKVTSVTHYVRSDSQIIVFAEFVPGNAA